MEKAPPKNHCLLYEGQRVSCLLSSNFLMCRLSFVASPPPTIRLVIAISLVKCSLRADEIKLWLTPQSLVIVCKQATT